ncbi:hypothetical protein M569_01904 [Genlisea aurea]|uniref:F-box domain-containing protein n=1 Tax=Genlisea aurea TaxID=192259 RepID=S8D648_9LAMI|nr:hypothetical protein M569_01904 [Genlisea aurea]
MDSLPDALIHCILSRVCSAKDVASCMCVSKRWKETIPYLNALFFPRNIFDNLRNGGGSSINPDSIISHMISSLVRLEDLVVYCPFSVAGLATWLSLSGHSLKSLELRVDSIIELQNSGNKSPSKMELLRAACNVESLKLWGVFMIQSPKWDVFYRLKNLEIVGASLRDYTLSEALRACPNITHLVLLGCEGLMDVVIENPLLEHCKLDFFGAGDCYLTLNTSRIESLDVQGCGVIRVLESQNLKNLCISNNAGRINVVDFGRLAALETLSMRGVQWSWDAISRLLEMAGEVKHLYMKVEFTGDTDNLLEPFPEIDLVEFFNGHPKLETFDIHGAMFAALCQKNSLRNVDSRFSIESLSQMVITVRSPLNAEQKMSTLDSLVRYCKNLERMRIRILRMKSSHSSADEFFEEICRFQSINRRIVSIE